MSDPQPREIHHICYAVHDLDEAIPRYAEALNKTFRPIEVLHIEHVEQPLYGREEPHAIDRRLSYSLEGPPYVELIELVTEPNDFASNTQAEGLHHIGMFATDNEAWRQQLKSTGVRTEMRCLDADGDKTVFWMTAPGDLYGSRVEFLDDSLRGELAEWVKLGRELDTWQHT